jgi:hypothetical protein
MTSIAAIELRRHGVDRRRTIMRPGKKDHRAVFRAIQADAPASTNEAAQARLGAGSWIVLIVLLSLLVVTGVVAYLGWRLENGIEVSTAGYVAMSAGVIFSLVVGCGLMALIFYSSRSGYDEPPVLIRPGYRPEVSGQRHASKGLR